MSEMVLSNDVAVDATAGQSADVEQRIRDMRDSNVSLYSSFSQDDFNGKLKAAAAMTSSTPVAEHLGKPIALTDLVIHPVQLVNEQTGALETSIRTVMIDKDGNAFHAISAVISSRLYDLIGVLGQPSDWPDGGVKVVVTREKGNGANFYYDLKVVA